MPFIPDNTLAPGSRVVFMDRAMDGDVDLFGGIIVTLSARHDGELRYEISLEGEKRAEDEGWRRVQPRMVYLQVGKTPIIEVYVNETYQSSPWEQEDRCLD